MNEYIPLNIKPPPPGRFENDRMTFQLKHRPWPAVAFWFRGEWLMPPHWNDFPGEEIIAWERKSTPKTVAQ
jgi:hypothetical protein